MRIEPVAWERRSEVARLLGTLYPEKGHLPFDAFLDLEAEVDRGQVLGAWDHGRLIGTAGFFPRDLQVRGRVWTAAMMGLGAVIPEARGRGVYPELLQAASLAAAESGCCFGVGFSRTPAEYETLLGAAVLPMSEWTTASPRVGRSPKRWPVRVVDVGRDLTALAALYAGQSESVDGTVIRSDRYWYSQPSWSREDLSLFLGATDGSDAVRAYIRAKVKGPNVRIVEAAADPNAESAYEDLLGSLVSRVGGRVTFCGNSGHPLGGLLFDWGAEQTTSTTMTVQLLNLRELSRSCCALPDWPEHMAFHATRGGYVISSTAVERDRLPSPDGPVPGGVIVRDVLLGYRPSRVAGWALVGPPREFAYWHADRL